MSDISHTQMVGQTFGRLLVLESLVTSSGHSQVKVRCQCGNEIWTPTRLVRSGKKSDCGKHAREFKRELPARFTYAIEAVGVAMVEIGKSWDLKTRVASLQLGSPVKIRLIATCAGDIEKKLHAELKQWHSHGEWFHATAEVMGAISTQMAPVNSTESTE